MVKRTRILACLSLAAAMVASSCDVFDNQNDIIMTNGSGFSLAKVSMDGVDRGPIGDSETRKLNNVNNGVHMLDAYRNAEDTTPCDTHATGNLQGKDNDYWVIRCD